MLLIVLRQGRVVRCDIAAAAVSLRDGRWRTATTGERFLSGGKFNVVDVRDSSLQQTTK